jgi:two-component system nitrogen regulation response regulator NtrX
MKPYILICDDEPAIRKTLGEILEDEGHEVKLLDSGEALVQNVMRSDRRIDAVFLDVWLPGMDGVTALEKLQANGFQAPVILISGHANLDVAVKATKLGAFDFLEKPLNLDKVILTLANALKQRKLERRQAQLEAQLPRVQMIGESEAMVRLKEDIEMAAPSPSRVLILGESGAGKEVAARLIHEKSDRHDEPFVEMNCAAIPEELIESELFGHVKGSFTGAIADKRGKFEEADGGTLFLDEIADMSLTTQAKVLRVLQEQRFQPVGSSKTISVDVRVIAATNKDLEQEISNGNFREDLYYRLNVIPMFMPPLRERQADIQRLSQHFIDNFAQEYGRQPIRIMPEALAALTQYEWPGNVRELRNIIERLMIMSRTGEVQLADLPRHISGAKAASFQIGSYNSLKEAREAFERQFILQVLEDNNGNMSKTAEALKLERSNLYKKMKSYGIQP